ncbi:MAG: flagellar biosynthesis protein FlgD [Rhodoferax ferrireducens]|uniref:Basal-body rod modification protein FlgD n=1 Tax=Rhodoferax ferrireducens TaxID=192843 RepID=A0A1W9KRM7_9BURK|nr:MAG: flagellar biosynthesis protein FlgD [Rhodoferax ferrireducens]
MITPIATTSTSALASSSTSSASSSEEAQDRFLKLLVAQLNNQDPMNPMDNAEMTSQMAQINTVTGIQQVNDTLKSMAEQFTAMQVLQGSNMVGHDVLVSGNTLRIQDGVGSAAIELNGRAESVQVSVLSPGGQVVDTLNLGALDTGRHNFEWDASSYSFAGNPTFTVSATLGGQAIGNSTLTRATVSSVGSESGAMKVQLTDGSAIDYSSVKAIL